MFKTPGFRSNNRSLEVERDFYQKSEDYEELSEDYNIEGSLVGWQSNTRFLNVENQLLREKTIYRY